MVRRSVKSELQAIQGDLQEAVLRLDALLLPPVRKVAQPADTDVEAEAPAEEGGGDLGDDFDEGTTGEEGDLGDLGDLGGEGDLGDLGGDFGGGGGGGAFGGGGGFGADVGAEEAPAGGADDEVKGDIEGLRTEMDGIKRTLVNLSEALKRLRDPLGDPASGNDAMHSV